MTLYENECLAAGKDPEAVRKLARTLDRAAKQAEALGVKIFGGSGNGTIRSYDGDAQHPLVLALVDGHMWDGGDGAEFTDENGLMRGE